VKRGRGSSTAKSEESVTDDFPRSWNLRDIEKAVPPYGGAGDHVYVLAWKIEEDERPFRVEASLVLKDIGKPSERGRWCLSHLYRHPRSEDKEWHLPPIWVSPPYPLGPKKAVTINYFKRFKDKPSNKEIYETIKEIRCRLAQLKQVHLAERLLLKLKLLGLIDRWPYHMLTLGREASKQEEGYLIGCGRPHGTCLLSLASLAGPAPSRPPPEPGCPRVSVYPGLRPEIGTTGAPKE
jgi:hypothetical protein